MSDRLHFVRQFITVSCTCSKSNSSTKDLHADGLPRRGYTAYRGLVESVARVREINQTMAQRTINVSGAARGFVIANKSCEAAQASLAIFFYSMLRPATLDLSLPRSTLTRRKYRGVLTPEKVRIFH